MVSSSSTETTAATRNCSHQTAPSRFAARPARLPTAIIRKVNSSVNSSMMTQIRMKTSQRIHR